MRAVLARALEGERFSRAEMREIVHTIVAQGTSDLQIAAFLAALRTRGETPEEVIGAAYGGRVVHAKSLMHGKTSLIRHRSSDIFAGLPNPFEATRYHSLAVSREGLPAALVVTAETDDGEIMGLRHRDLPVYGVQFHPESILTVQGKALLANFLRLARGDRARAA